MKKAFTLIEALIALSVATFTLTATAYGVTRIRYSIELENGYSDIASYISLIQNKAKNSVASANSIENSGEFIGSAPDYYMLEFNTGFIDFYVCYSTVGVANLNCSLEESDVAAKRFTSLNISVESGCSKIAFQKRTANVVKLGSSDDIIDYVGGAGVAKTCNISISHNNYSKIKTITFNLEENAFKAD